MEPRQDAQHVSGRDADRDPVFEPASSRTSRGRRRGPVAATTAASGCRSAARCDCRNRSTGWVTHEFVHANITKDGPRRLVRRRGSTRGSRASWNHPIASWVRKALAQTSEVFALEDLSEGFDHLNGAEALVAYAESAVAAEILCERLGPNLGVFVQMVGSGHTPDQALSTLNVRPEAFHAEWRKRIGIR